MFSFSSKRYEGEFALNHHAESLGNSDCSVNSDLRFYNPCSENIFIFPIVRGGKPKDLLNIDGTLFWAMLKDLNFETISDFKIEYLTPKIKYVEMTQHSSDFSTITNNCILLNFSKSFGFDCPIDIFAWRKS